MSRKGNPKGPAHGMWKGDDVGLTALHDWIRSRIPKPTACQKCGATGKSLDLHNIDKKYSRDLSQWIYLCKKCHAEEEAEARKKCYTPEAVQKRADSIRGRPVSEETRAKISAAKRKPRRQVPCACGCGTMITTPDAYGRERKYVHGHNPAFRSQGAKNRKAGQE